MKINKDNIFELSKNGEIEILKSDLVDKVKNIYENTPLHDLAFQAKIQVLNHPSVDKVKNKKGDTPLHILVWKRVIEIKYLKEKYPWFKFKRGEKITENLINRILSTPQSIQFIRRMNQN